MSSFFLMMVKLSSLKLNHVAILIHFHPVDLIRCVFWNLTGSLPNGITNSIVFNIQISISYSLPHPHFYPILEIRYCLCIFSSLILLSSSNISRLITPFFFMKSSRISEFDNDIYYYVLNHIMSHCLKRNIRHMFYIQKCRNLQNTFNDMRQLNSICTPVFRM
jgi:hypothetical protein